jgi:hypothetical protein
MRSCRQAEVVTAEEEARVYRAVRSKRSIAEPLRRPFIAQELVSVVVVTRDPLAAVAQDTAPVMPLAQTVEDDDLVPERAFGFDGHDVVNAKIKIRKIRRDVRRH